MALTSNFVLADASAANHTFAATSVTVDGTSRLDIASTLTEPGLMIVKHSVSGKGNAITNRHLLQFSLTKKDALGVSNVLTVNLTVAVPQNAVITRAMINDQLKYITNFLGTTANVDAILRGES